MGSKDNSVELVEPEAATWVWNSLWSREDVNHVKFDILDVMWFSNSKDREVVGSLFTATDKTIKSVKKAKWNVMEFGKKCTVPNKDSKSKILAHVRTSNDWRIVHRSGAHLLEISPACKFMIALGGKLSSHKTFMEQMIEFGEIGTKEALKPPKVQNYRLIDQNPVISHNFAKCNGTGGCMDNKVNPLLELNRVISKDKVTNDNCRLNTLQLIKILESRKSIKIRRIRVIYAIDHSGNLTDAIAGSDSNVNGMVRSTNRIWLHHVAEIEYRSKTSLNGLASMSSLAFDVNSNLSRSNISNMGSSKVSIRHGGHGFSMVDLEKRSMVTSEVRCDGTRGLKKSVKCSGDFCSFIEYEEYQHMNSNSDFDLMGEAKKAKQRHRRLNEDERVTKDGIAGTIHGAKIQALKQSPDKGNDVDGVEAYHSNVDSNDIHELMRGVDDDFSPEKHGDVNFNSILNPKYISNAKSVQQKSISLARLEMRELENNDVYMDENSTTNDNIERSMSISGGYKYDHNHLWSEALQHWWFRMGRSIVLFRGSLKDKPKSSAIEIQQSILAANLENNSPQKAASEVGSNISKSSKINGKLSKQPSLFSLAGSDMNDGTSNSLYSGETESRKMSKSESANKVGFLSGYYAEATVCDRCYMVYRELDNARELRQKKMLLERKSEKEKLLYGDGDYDRNIERRIFEQRKMVSRLTKPKQKIKNEKDKDDNMHKESIFGEGSMTHMTTNLSSIYPEGSYFPNQSSYFDENGGSQFQSSTTKKKVTRPIAPSANLLPPLPWQLNNNQEAQEAYVNNMVGKNAFARHIGDKIYHQNVITDNLEQESLLNKLVKQNEGSYMVAQNEDELNWHEATGQFKKHSKNKKKTKFQRHHLLQELPPHPLDEAQLNQSKSADSIYRKKKNETKKKTISLQQFDPTRLMHPYQRDIYRRRQLERENSQKTLVNAQEAMENQEQAEMDELYLQSNTGQLQMQTNTNFLPPIHPNHSATSMRHGSHGNLHSLQEEEEDYLVDSKHNESSVSDSTGTAKQHHSSITKQLASKIKNEHSNLGDVDSMAKGSSKGSGSLSPPRFATTRIIKENEEEEDEEDDDDDGIIGWSPFAVV